MASLPVQILLGVYIGILTGIVPALIGGLLGFLFKYLTGVTIPGFGVVVLGLAIAGVNGGLLALNDESIKTSENATALVVAIIVVLMLTLYAHAKGDQLGASLPRRVSLRKLTERTLSSDVVERVGGRGQVRVRVTGDVADMEGYPPLPADLRQRIRDGTWTFPADVPLSELETRVADRLRTEFDLADVMVTLDERARATVTAAPPVSGLSKRVPTGKRAVSVNALLPTGLARGDEVRLHAPEGTFAGTVVSARTGAGTPAKAEPTATDGGVEEVEPEVTPPAAPVTDGGDGRITVAVDRSDAQALMRTAAGRVVVQSRGTRREFELTTLLRRTGGRFRRVTVKGDGPLDGATIGEVAVRDTYGVAVLAVRHEGWQIAPRGSTEVVAGDELFVVGPRDALQAFEEVAA